MEYTVLLAQNGKYRKTFFKGKNKSVAFMNYRKLIDESDSVMYERRFVNNNGIIPVEYTLYIVKLPVEGEKRRLVRDKLGKWVEEDLLFGKYTVMDSIPFKIEEELWIYGNDNKKERKNIRDVVKLLMKGMGKERASKEIIVCHNKLVIYNEDEFDMVICKCIEDAQRLHHLLYRAVAANKIKGLLFMGTANAQTVSLIYEIIHEETGWPMTKIRRTTTRP